MMLQYRLCTVIHTVKSHAFLRKNQSLFRITFFANFSATTGWKSV